MKNKFRFIMIVVIITAIVILWIFDVFSYIHVDRIGELKAFFQQFGIWAPLIFIVTYILATILFLPGLPLTLLAGVAFGPVYGSLWTSIASTIGACLAFLVGRYTGRDYIVRKFSDSIMFVKIDSGVKNLGWKMVAMTRLVPLFPFNAQNYIYGLTDISFKTYGFVSWLAMLPATIAYVFLAGAIIGGEGDATKTITYAGIGLALLIFLSVLGKRIIQRQKLERD